MDDPRPSLARTSMSSQATHNTMSTREASSSTAPWEHSDIRGDVMAGWGGGGGGVPAAAAAAGAVGNNNNDNGNNHHESEWGWKLHHQVLRPVPPFVPLDSLLTRRLFLDDHMGKIEDISQRISSACQHLSIHVNWDDMCPSATLVTMERVEMAISMYWGDAIGNEVSTPSKPPPANIIIELQRRKGCSVTFHHYRRFLLDAAEGKFNPTAFDQADGLDKPFGRDRCNQPLASPLASLTREVSNSTSSTASSGRPTLSRPSLRGPSFSADDASEAFAGLKTEGDLSFDSSAGSHQLHDDDDANTNDIVDKALVALNIAASLIKKDRVDARRLGMESLVLLTDSLRAGIETAKIASRVVLLGSAREDLNGGLDGEDDVDALFDESAGLGIRETILEMIMEDDRGGKYSEDDEEIEREFHDSLFNLCLTVLSNALHTMEASEGTPRSSSGSTQHDVYGGDDNDTKPSPGDSPPSKPSPTRRRAATEPGGSPDRQVTKKFIDETNSTFGVDVLSSLIRILGQAKANPHDAYHSARCLGVLFKGCGNSHRCRARRDLDAKRIVSAALEVGSRTHAKLADASRVAMVALVTDDDQSMEEVQEGEEEQTELESEIETGLSSAVGMLKSDSGER
mmetsp:Transcript_29588/g.46476  ORF Transcript_29588/g.46476 Transcript_29588/m.46476 type:complete len:627 (+) Transcript_29588:428-2308(+)